MGEMQMKEKDVYAVWSIIFDQPTLYMYSWLKKTLGKKEIPV